MFDDLSRLDAVLVDGTWLYADDGTAKLADGWLNFRERTLGSRAVIAYERVSAWRFNADPVFFE